MNKEDLVSVIKYIYLSYDSIAKKHEKKKESISPLTGWRHRLLRHRSRCAARGYISPYLFFICLDYVLRTSIDLIKENGFKLAKERSNRYITETIRARTTLMT